MDDFMEDGLHQALDESDEDEDHEGEDLELDDEEFPIRTFAEQIDNADVGRVLPAHTSTFVLENRQPRFNEGQIGGKKIFELPFKR